MTRKYTPDEFMAKAKAARKSAYRSIKEVDAKIGELRESAPYDYGIWNVCYDVRENEELGTVVFPDFEFGENQREIVITRDRDLYESISPFSDRENPLRLVDIKDSLEDDISEHYHSVEELIWSLLFPGTLFDSEKWDRLIREKMADKISEDLKNSSHEEREEIYANLLGENGPTEKLYNEVKEKYEHEFGEFLNTLYDGLPGFSEEFLTTLYELLDETQYNVLAFAEDAEDACLWDRVRDRRDRCIDNFSKLPDEEQIKELIELMTGEYASWSDARKAKEDLLRKTMIKFLIVPFVKEEDPDSCKKKIDGICLLNDMDDPLDDIDSVFVHFKTIYRPGYVVMDEKEFWDYYRNSEYHGVTDIIKNVLKEYENYLNDEIWSVAFIENGEAVDYLDARADKPEDVLPWVQEHFPGQIMDEFKELVEKNDCRVDF